MLRVLRATRRPVLQGRALPGCGCGISSTALVYQRNGEPGSVIQCEEREIAVDSGAALAPGDVLVQLEAAPINPADVNMIQGVYALRPPLPAVGGNEGAFRVLQAGTDAQEAMPVGSLVVPRQPGIGTWRTHAILPAEQLACVPDGVSATAAAQLAVNPGTALRMLRDFAHLQPGDVVMQNAGNSAVGQCVSQLAASVFGARTLSVIRARASMQETEALKQRLHRLGATWVVTEDELASDRRLVTTLTQSRAPVLGLNAVGGASATALARSLAPGASLVTYGGMSRKPITMPTGLFIFSDLTLRGYWHSRWVTQASREDVDALRQELCQLILQGHLDLEATVATYPLSRYSEAFTALSTEQRDVKIILTR